MIDRARGFDLSGSAGPTEPRDDLSLSAHVSRG